MIVMVGGIKGGTGKSTVATNLAAYLADKKNDVLLLDVDPQATAYKWALRRQKNHPNAPVVHTSQASDQVYNVVRDMASRYHHVVIDAGGHASGAMKSAMLATQKLYIPLRPSQADLETLAEMVAMVADVKTVNTELEAFSLISMAPNHPNTTERQDARTALVEVPNINRSQCMLYDRKIFRDALYEGVGVVEMTNNKGKSEVQLLAQEIYHG